MMKYLLGEIYPVNMISDSQKINLITTDCEDTLGNKHKKRKTKKSWEKKILRKENRKNEVDKKM